MFHNVDELKPTPNGVKICRFKEDVRLKMNERGRRIAGSCHAEKELADSFAARDDWDIALMEIGINMLELFEPEEFEKRFHYLADKLYCTGRKIIFLTVPSYSGYYKNFLRGQRL